MVAPVVIAGVGIWVSGRIALGAALWRGRFSHLRSYYLCSLAWGWTIGLAVLLALQLEYPLWVIEVVLVVFGVFITESWSTALTWGIRRLQSRKQKGAE